MAAPAPFPLRGLRVAGPDAGRILYHRLSSWTYTQRTDRLQASITSSSINLSSTTIIIITISSSSVLGSSPSVLAILAAPCRATPPAKPRPLRSRLLAEAFEERVDVLAQRGPAAAAVLHVEGIISPRHGAHRAASPGELETEGWRDGEKER